MRLDARWGLLFPAIIGAWFCVAITGMFVSAHVERALCEPENYSGGMCYGLEADHALEVVMNVFIAVCALVTEAVAVVVAPSHKREVVLATFAVGSGLAFFGIFLGEVTYTASAISAGLLGLVIALWWLGRAEAQP
jgi:glycerol uptake facilitator-like aquaporin